MCVCVYVCEHVNVCVHCGPIGGSQWVRNFGFTGLRHLSRPHSSKACDYFFAVQEKQRCIFVLRKVFEKRSNVNTDFSQGQDNTKAKTASRETLRIRDLTHINKELFLHQDVRKGQ